MAIQAGYRGHRVINYTTPNVVVLLDDSMAHVWVEVTNDTAATVLFYPNDYPKQGHPAGDGIPVKAGATRAIPMQIGNFRADGNVTVVAYRL